MNFLLSYRLHFFNEMCLKHCRSSKNGLKTSEVASVPLERFLEKKNYRGKTVVAP